MGVLRCLGSMCCCIGLCFTTTYASEFKGASCKELSHPNRDTLDRLANCVLFGYL